MKITEIFLKGPGRHSIYRPSYRKIKTPPPNADGVPESYMPTAIF
jgi:hypothetical protein